MCARERDKEILDLMPTSLLSLSRSFHQADRPLDSADLSDLSLQCVGRDFWNTINGMHTQSLQRLAYFYLFSAIKVVGQA